MPPATVHSVCRRWWPCCIATMAKLWLLSCKHASTDTNTGQHQKSWHPFQAAQRSVSALCQKHVGIENLFHNVELLSRSKATSTQKTRVTYALLKGSHSWNSLQIVASASASSMSVLQHVWPQWYRKHQLMVSWTFPVGISSQSKSPPLVIQFVTRDLFGMVSSRMTRTLKGVVGPWPPCGSGDKKFGHLFFWSHLGPVMSEQPIRSNTWSTGGLCLGERFTKFGLSLGPEDVIFGPLVDLPEVRVVLVAPEKNRSIRDKKTSPPTSRKLHLDDCN